MSEPIKIYGSYQPYRNLVDTHAYITSFNYDYQGHIIVIKSSRLIYGKTLFCIAELIRHAINYDKSDSVFISPTYTQALENYKKITLSPLSTIIKRADASTLNILFQNNSRIRFFSSELNNSIRGITIKTLLVVDEAAFIRDEIWHEVILPTTIKYRPLIILCSTPYYKNGFFYDNWISDNSKKFDWVKDYPENIELNKEFLEVLLKLMPKHIFKTEYMAEWLTTDDKALFNIDGNLIEELSKKPTKSIGIDFGSGSNKDYTVLSGFDEDNNQTLLWYNNDIDSYNAISVMINILREELHSKAKIIAEKNSIGTIYIELLKRGGIYISSFNTTNKSKRQIVENMITLTQNNKVGLLRDQELILLLSRLRLEKTQTGLLTYNAERGYHDDIVIASALALYNKNDKYMIL